MALILKNLKNGNQEPFYILLSKIHLLSFIPDTNIVSIISDFMYSDNCVVVKCKNRIFRSLKIINIDYFLFNHLKNRAETLLGFNLSQRKIDHEYSKDELDTIKLYGGDKINDIVLTNVKDGEIDIMYNDLCMIDNTNDGKYKITKLSTSVKVKYDYVCGMDILLIILQNVFDIQYKKISKKTRTELRENGFKIITI